MSDALYQLASAGLGVPGAILLLNRVAVGVFFAISGYHKLFNKERHRRLVSTLEHDGVPWVKFNQWWVPFWELVSGTLLVVGFFAPVQAVILMIVCLVACWVDGVDKVRAYKPIDLADVIDDYLYLPEVMYIVCLAIVVAAGPGALAVTG